MPKDKGTAVQWMAIGELLAKGDRALRARIELAKSDPAGYMKKHARELRERGVDEPTPRLPLIALLDGLEAAKRVALVDWKSPAEDVEHALASVKPRVKIDWTWTKPWDEDDLDDVSTSRIVQAAAAHAPPNVTLLNLDTSSDQLAIVFVDAARAKKVVAAMKAVGHRAEPIVPKALRAPKARAVSPKGGTAMATWPKCDPDAFGTWRTFVNRKTLRALWLVKYGTAFDVMIGPSWSINSKKEKRVFATEAKCNAAYIAFYEGLRREGWLQLSAEEHAKELRANAAAKKKGTLRKES